MAEFTVTESVDGWWAKLTGNSYPLGNWRMDRGPYRFRWMALLAFPIQRWTRK